MFKKLYPKEYIDSAYNIDFCEFFNKGYKALVLDVDNTLVEHGAPADERAARFFENVKSIGFKTCILSNNHEPRIKPFADAVGSDYIYDAGKPKKSGYEKAMKIMGSSISDTLFVGDQVFTDIWGANKSGIYSILVKYIKYDYKIRIRLKRLGEKIVLYFFFRQCKAGK